jgi:hypothetical protein
MFSVITNIYNKKTKGPTLMELFTATGKLKKRGFFWQLEMFDVCTTGDTAHIDTIFKFLPHTRLLSSGILYSRLQRVTISGAVIIQFVLLMMGMLMLETCRGF